MNQSNPHFNRNLFLRYMPFDTIREAAAYAAAMAFDPFVTVYSVREVTFKSKDPEAPASQGFVVPIRILSIDDTVDQVNEKRIALEKEIRQSRGV